MRSERPAENSEFDAYAADYDAALARGLVVTGEAKEYFAARRVEWLSECLRNLGATPGRILDFGCGTGSSAPFLLSLNATCSLEGVDISAGSIGMARKLHGSARAEFFAIHEYRRQGHADLVFCNGVFHHIKPAERLDALKFALECTQPRGLFSFWENNPWNPGTRYVMSRIPFDRDAAPLSCLEGKRLLRTAGFEIIRTDFLFYFPRAMKGLRGLEKFLVRLPLGGQYQILSRKP